jgi:two-component sensor histidine kinase
VLIALALMPPFLLTLYNTVRWQLVLEKEARDEVLAAARLVSAEFAQIIDGSRQLMVAMSRHPAVPDREDECASYFKSVIADIPAYREAAFIDKAGRFHCSTIPIPSSLDVTDRTYFREPFITGDLTIGTLVRGRVTRGTSVHISLPHRDAASGEVTGITVLVLNPEQLASDLAARPWRTGHRVMVLDREGTLVLTIPRGNDDDARVIAQQIFPKIGSAASGTVDVQGPEGRAEIVGFVPVREPPASLFVAVAIERDVALAQAWVINARSLTFALVTMLLAIAAVWIATHILINRPIRALVRTARLRESGDMAPFPALTLSTEFGQLSAALSRMSDKIHELVDQKTFLLRELQHRVMNSLTLLSSVLDMQRRNTRNMTAKEHLARARDRVVAMGTVYRFLYQTNTSEHVEFSKFLEVICKESQNAYAGAHKPVITVQADPLTISGTHAIALAMLTHELITNALKHAYPEGEPGAINVTLHHHDDGMIELRVADQGRGLPEDFQISQSGSLGMKVIASTAAQLGGTLDINRLDPGTEFVIRLSAEKLVAKD